MRCNFRYFHLLGDERSQTVMSKHRLGRYLWIFAGSMPCYGADLILWAIVSNDSQCLQLCSSSKNCKADYDRIVGISCVQCCLQTVYIDRGFVVIYCGFSTPETDTLHLVSCLRWKNSIEWNRFATCFLLSYHCSHLLPLSIGRRCKTSFPVLFIL